MLCNSCGCTERSHVGPDRRCPLTSAGSTYTPPPGVARVVPPNEGAGIMRTFPSGATRNVVARKPDYEGFLSPLVIAAFGAYMDKHREQADGVVRDSDNWQLGMPRKEYVKSGWRHFLEWWRAHRAGDDAAAVEAALALLFNIQGYLHESLKALPPPAKPQ